MPCYVEWSTSSPHAVRSTRPSLALSSASYPTEKRRQQTQRDTLQPKAVADSPRRQWFSLLLRFLSVGAVPMSRDMREDAMSEVRALAEVAEAQSAGEVAEAVELGLRQTRHVLVHGYLAGRKADKPTMPPSQRIPRQTTRRQSVESGGTRTPPKS